MASRGANVTRWGGKKYIFKPSSTKINKIIHIKHKIQTDVYTYNLCDNEIHTCPCFSISVRFSNLTTKLLSTELHFWRQSL
jgi:hypothetical protein